jgi:hypothetical protein
MLQARGHDKACDNSGRLIEPYGRYPSRRSSTLEPLTPDELLMPTNSGWGGRIRTSEWRDQNPLPYHLATPQQLSKLSHRTTYAGVRLLTIRGGPFRSTRATHASHPWCVVPARASLRGRSPHAAHPLGDTPAIVKTFAQSVRRMRLTWCAVPARAHAATHAPAKHSIHEQRSSSSDQARAPRGAPRRSRWHRARRYRNPFR